MLENVCGALTSHGGEDFRALGEALSEGGYRFGAIVVDAVDFVPQSRPRLFILAASADLEIPEGILAGEASAKWHPPALREARRGLSARAERDWLWWRLPDPPRRNTRLIDVIEDEPRSVRWRTPEETRRLLSLMAEIHLQKIERARREERRLVGAVYKRTRQDRHGAKTQRAEVRFDDIAGCLRTPAGGSSRQSLVIVEGESVRSRLLSSREAARLMGLPDSYALPERYNDAYHLVGDGVVAPVVRHLAEHLLEPILRANAAVPKARRLRA